MWLFRSCFGSEPAADDAHAGDSDPDTAVADDVVTSTWLRAVSTPADDDVELTRVESRVSENVHIYSRSVRHQRQPAEWSSGDSRLDVREPLVQSAVRLQTGGLPSSATQPLGTSVTECNIPRGTVARYQKIEFVWVAGYFDARHTLSVWHTVIKTDFVLTSYWYLIQFYCCTVHCTSLSALPSWQSSADRIIEHTPN